MTSTPECLDSLPRETIRRFLEGLPLFGFDPYLHRTEAFLMLASVLPPSRNGGFVAPKHLGILPSILTYGRSGTGKTTFGYALYLHLSEKLPEDVVYYHVKLGALLNPNLGQTSRNIEQLFEFISDGGNAKEIRFLHFDEVDAIGLSRAKTTEHDAIRRALSSMLSSLDKLLLLTSVQWIMYATTNIIDRVDSALLRRFHLKLNFEQTPWPTDHYYKLLASLIPENNNGTRFSSLLRQIAQTCSKKRFTPNDVRQLVLDAFVSAHQESNPEQAFPSVLRALAKGKHRTLQSDSRNGEPRLD